MPEAPTIRSCVGPAGVRSPRRFTAAEIAAARRRGLADGGQGADTLSGPLFWATGDYVPDRVRQAAGDYALLATAIEREWKRPWDADGGDS